MDDKTTITISRDDLSKACAKTMENEHLDMLLKRSPHLVLLLATFSAELITTLFDETEIVIADEDKND